MVYAIIIGTRPEIIKISPIIRLLRKEEYFVLYSGQNDYVQNTRFFDEFKLPYPKHVLSWNRPESLGGLLYSLNNVLNNESPDLVLTHGDTYTSLFGSLAASKLGIAVGHIEAGLRCYDSQLPEEINRIAVDHMAKYLFAPSEDESSNLMKEGIHRGVYVVGNTVVDAIFRYKGLASMRLRRGPKDYFFLTLHRRENVDNPCQFKSILDALIRVHGHYGIPFVFPVHPRTRIRIGEFGLTEVLNNKAFIPTDPMGYLECLAHQKHSLVVFTDSGGLQEESCILGVPCITIRRNTERPATLRNGSNVLVKPQQLDFLEGFVAKALNKRTDWHTPFGDGNAAERIVKILRENVK